MKYAWIENGQIRDVAWTDPNKIYHPDVAKLYNTQVPDDAANGDGWANGQLIKPEPSSSPAQVAAPRKWSQTDIRNGLSLAEKVKWDNDTAPEVKTVKAEMASPQELATTTEVLEMLVAAGVISQASMDKVLA